MTFLMIFERVPVSPVLPQPLEPLVLLKSP
jgi:hypothetical protein